MVAPEKLPAALEALHSVLVRIRFLAGEGAASSELYKMLDSAEVLPSLIGERSGDTTGEFLAALKDLGNQFPPLAGLDQVFNSGTTRAARATNEA